MATFYMFPTRGNSSPESQPTEDDPLDRVISQALHPSSQSIKPPTSTEGVRLRKASEAESIPWMDSRVTLLHIVPVPLRIKQAVTVEAKVNMLGEVIRTEGIVLACWPGEYRQDVFLVDDPAAVLETIWYSR